MAITNGYATLGQIKGALGIPLDDTGDDTMLEVAVEAASRTIDQETGRVFYGATGETRYFTAEDAYAVFVDDLRTVTSLLTDENGDRVYERTWATTDYDLEPNSGPPYTRLKVAPLGLYTFPPMNKSIRITGDWGYCDTGEHPTAITQACLILAGRLFKRKDAPMGVAGSQEMGFIRLPSSDPDVKALLHRYRRLDL